MLIDVALAPHPGLIVLVLTPLIGSVIAITLNMPNRTNTGRQPLPTRLTILSASLVLLLVIVGALPRLRYFNDHLTPDSRTTFEQTFALTLTDDASHGIARACADGHEVVVSAVSDTHQPTLITITSVEPGQHCRLEATPLD